MHTHTALITLAALTLGSLASAQALRQPQPVLAQSSPMRGSGAQPTHSGPEDTIRYFTVGRPKGKQAAFKAKSEGLPDAGLGSESSGGLSADEERKDARNPSDPERWFTAEDGSVCIEFPMEDTIRGRNLVDVLTVERRGSLWWEYARDVVKVTSRLSSLELGNTTLLVPVNSAIMKMPRKPHQNANGETSDDEAQTNTERFLAGHIIPDFNELNTTHPVKTLLGTEVEIIADEERGGLYINPGDIEVVDVNLATNGKVLYMNGVLPF